jgi:16S rRNA (cytidine1402-2'-O)-methyltransferase
MSLTVVSTPIGNPDDITLHALKALKACDVVIGEDRKPLIRLLKSLELWPKPFLLLNEHTDQQELNDILEACKQKNVCQISDCGTPNFCDPGAMLADLCYKNKIPMNVAPGASSLLSLMAICGVRMNSFYFRGFLSANREKRQIDWLSLKQEKKHIFIMDTPYRFSKTLEELNLYFPNSIVNLGIDLTKPEQIFAKGTAKQLMAKYFGIKREFILHFDNSH